MNELLEAFLERDFRKAKELARKFDREEILDAFHFELGWSLFAASCAMHELKMPPIRGRICLTSSDLVDKHETDMLMDALRDMEDEDEIIAVLTR